MELFFYTFRLFLLAFYLVLLPSSPSYSQYWRGCTNLINFILLSLREIVPQRYPMIVPMIAPQWYPMMMRRLYFIRFSFIGILFFTSKQTATELKWTLHPTTLFILTSLATKHVIAFASGPGKNSGTHDAAFFVMRTMDKSLPEINRLHLDNII